MTPTTRLPGGAHPTCCAEFMIFRRANFVEERGITNISWLTHLCLFYRIGSDIRLQIEQTTNRSIATVRRSPFFSEIWEIWEIWETQQPETRESRGFGASGSYASCAGVLHHHELWKQVGAS